MKSPRHLLAGIALLAITFPAIGEQPQLADVFLGESVELKAPVDRKSEIDNTNKQTVLIYYANETSPNTAEMENYQKLLEWLASSKSTKIQKIGKSIQDDLEIFSTIVDQELATIKQRVVAAKDGKSPSVAIFTNRLARDGQFQVSMPGKDGVTNVPFTVPRLKELTYASNPLSHPIVFETALAAVSRQFTPENHQFVLVTKSHGDRVRLLAPLVAVDVSKIERDAFLSRLEKALSKQPETQDGVELDTRHSVALLDQEYSLGNDDLSGKEQLSGSGQEVAAAVTSELVAKPGITKANYATTIERILASTGMQFSLLLVEACRSPFEEGVVSQIETEEADIGHLYTSDMSGHQYTTLEYGKVFDRVDAGVSFTASVQQELLLKIDEQKLAYKGKKENLGATAAVNALPKDKTEITSQLSGSSRGWGEINASFPAYSGLIQTTPAVEILLDGKVIAYRSADEGSSPPTEVIFPAYNLSYEIRLSNPRLKWDQNRVWDSNSRKLFDIEVDGLSAMDGKPRSGRQNGYILPLDGSTTIMGWRTDDQNVKKFVVSHVEESLANKKGTSGQTGKITVRVYRERQTFHRDINFWGAPQLNGRSNTYGSARGQGIQSALPAPPLGAAGTAEGSLVQSQVRRVKFEIDSSQVQTLEFTYRVHNDSKK